MTHGLYITEYADKALLRALAEMGCKISTVIVRDAVWALAEDPGYTLIVYDHADADIQHFAACVSKKAPLCTMLAIPADNRAEVRAALLRAGADICLGRPLSFVELEALLHAFRRGRTLSSGSISGEGLRADQGEKGAIPLVINRRARKASYLEHQLPLSQQEFGLLDLLAESAGFPLDRLSIWRFPGSA